MRETLVRFQPSRAWLVAVIFMVAGMGAVWADPVHVAVQSLDMKRLLEVLAADPGSVNATEARGITPLHFAAGFGSKEFVEVLLDRGAQAGTKDANGNTPLHWAANVQPLCFGMAMPVGMSVCYLDVVQRLASSGATVNDPNRDGSTPLHLAAGQGVFGLVKALLDLGADPNAVDASGSTPLHLAVGKNAAIVAGLLLSQKADPDRRDGEGRTAFERATAANDPELLAVFKEYFRLRNLQQEKAP